MQHPEFKNPNKHFVISVFIQEDDFTKEKESIEDLGNQKNIKLVVQPCPYEAIEFLYRVDFDLPNHFSSFEKAYFWQAIEVKSTQRENIEKISNVHHAYLVAIVQNQATEVNRLSKELQSLL